MTSLITSRKRQTGFRARALLKRKEPSAFHYMTERATFWIAVVSVFAFVTGNMMGQHGWHVFWKSVLGGYDDSLIVYDGVVPPVRKVPDYRKWSLYGGDGSSHTYRQVPQDLLVDLPPAPSGSSQSDLQSIVYSVRYAGDYTSGRGPGSHFGDDIRLPEGTPVQAIMNGFVVRVGEEPGGFGKFVVLRHRAPDPKNPTELMTLYSGYAHLSSVLVSEGMVAKKGEDIALSGRTGNASGPHLHFQIDRDSCTDGAVLTSHPFWPFTGSEMRSVGMGFAEAINKGLHRERGLGCTVDGMLYVQAKYAPVDQAIASAGGSASSVFIASVRKRVLTRQERLQARLSRRAVAVLPVTVALSETTDKNLLAVSVSHTSSSSAPVLLAYADIAVPSGAAPLPQKTPVATVLVRHDNAFSEERETITLVLLDDTGNTVENPLLDGKLHITTAFGTAEFRPSVVSAKDFTRGEMQLIMTPHGQKTIVIQVMQQGKADGTLAKPMVFERN